MRTSSPNDGLAMFGMLAEPPLASNAISLEEGPLDALDPEASNCSARANQPGSPSRNNSIKPKCPSPNCFLTMANRSCS